MNFEQLSPRDRVLGLAGGGLAVLVLLFFAWSWYSGQIASRETRLATLNTEILKKERKVLLGKKAVKQLHEFRARSLPSDADVARSVYQKWLLALAGDSQLTDLNVAAGSTRPVQGVGHVLTFNVKGEATLPQVVTFLEGLERNHYLHRISRLSLKPLPNSKILDVSLTLEAMTIEKADATTTMPVVTEQRLTRATVAEYLTAICNRNLFGPKNLAPKLPESISQTATVDREFSFSVEAKDPDGDKVSYQLEPNELGATFDSKTGRLRWTPRKTGKFPFQLKALDNGLPAAEAKTTLTVNVEVPRPPDPPPKVVEGPKKLAFDHAKYTLLVAVLVVDDHSEVWLLIRPTGQTLKLREGEPFEVGSIRGIVVEIGPDDFIFEADGKRMLLENGASLDQAQPVRENNF